MPSRSQTTFYKRENSGEKLLNSFYLENEYMPFFDTHILHLFGYGESHYRPGCVAQFCHPYWSLQCIIVGEALLSREGRNDHVEAGDFILARPGVKYTYKVPNDTLISHRTILISNGEVMALLCGRGPLEQEDIFHLAEPSALHTHYESIKKKVSGSQPVTPAELSIMAYSFIMELYSQTGNDLRLEGDFAAIQKSIIANPAENITIAQLAERHHTTAHTLTRLFRKELDCTPLQYILGQRLALACKKLQLKNANIQRVATECGFHSASYFIRLFKKRFGFSPGNYQKSNMINENFLRKKLGFPPKAGKK